jgi:hypothetical protein
MEHRSHGRSIPHRRWWVRGSGKTVTPYDGKETFFAQQRSAKASRMPASVT